MTSRFELPILDWTVVLCLLVAVCEGFDIQSAGIAAAGLQNELHPSPSVLGLFFSAAGAGLLLGALVGGRLSDLIGRKPVLVGSVLSFGIFCFLTSIAPDMVWLIAARLLTGLGLGGAMPNLIAIAADASEAPRRSGTIAAAYIGLPLGGAFASFFVFAIPLDSWRVLFQIGGIAPLILIPFIIRHLRARRPARQALELKTHDSARQLLFGKGRAATTVVLWLAFFLIVLTLHLMINWLPLLLVGRGLATHSAVLSQAAFNLGGSLIGLAAGALLDSPWRRTAIAASVITFPVLLIVTAACPPWAALLFLLAFLLGGTIAAEQIILFAVIGARYDATSRGTVTGAAVAVGRIGSLVGPLVVGLLLAAGRSSAQVLITVLPIVLLGGASVALLGRRHLAEPA